MSDNQVSKRIAKRIASYVGEAGRLITHFSLEDIIKEELATMESQLQQADTTATSMGLALTEARMENERLREALEKIAGAPDDFTTTGEGHATCKSLAREALKKEGA